MKITAPRVLCAASSLVVAALFLAVSTGCGRDGPETVPVAGKVTLDGGAWPTAGRLYFNPLEPAAGLPRRSGTADFDTDGRFRVSSWEKGDGLVPGKYKVGVACWKVPPSMEGPPAVSYVAQPYQAAATSDKVIVIEPGSPEVELNWDVPRNPKAD